MDRSPCGFASRASGLQLADVLLRRYLFGSVFGGDVLELLLNTAINCLRGHSGARSLLMNAGAFVRQVLYHILECFVLGMFQTSNCRVLRDAGASHLLFEYFQHYRFCNFWLTRLLHAVGSFFMPATMHELLEGMKIVNSARPSSGNAASSSRSLPRGYKVALGFYAHMYNVNLPYAVFVSGLVCEVTHEALEQVLWMLYLCNSRGQHTSWGHIFKPYLAGLLGNVTQMALSFGARTVGALLGRCLSRDPLGGSIFWGERLALLAASPFIFRAASAVAARARWRLEVACPSTLEDEREEMRRRDEEEEERAAFDAAFHSFIGNNNNNNNNSDDVSVGAGAAVDFYKLLGVQSTASVEEVQRAYRRAALKYHPDRAAADPEAQRVAGERMAMLNQAYETLSSDSKRAMYDMSRTVGDGAAVKRHFEAMPPAVGVAAALGVLAGASLLVCFLFSVHYIAAFNRLTGPGRTPLRFVGCA